MSTALMNPVHTPPSFGADNISSPSSQSSESCQEAMASTSAVAPILTLPSAAQSTSISTPTSSTSPTLTSSTSSTSSTTAVSPSDITVRRSGERGRANHGWLNSYHTFSFASYYDGRYDGFHSVRVINEDRVSPSRGFPAHGHSDAEVFSYVVRGSLAHKDSMGNHEILGRGSVQFTSAGTGIRHSEFNASQREMVHFVQIWVAPMCRGLKPNYQTVEYDEKERVNRLALLVGPCGTDSKIHGKHAVISQDIKVYACVLQPDHAVTYTIPVGRVGYVHVVQDAISMSAEANKSNVICNGTSLAGGDGAYLTPTSMGASSTLTFIGKGSGAEFLLFDIKPIRKAIQPY